MDTARREGLVLTVHQNRRWDPDYLAIRRAVDGMDVIVHLGAYPNPADFIDVLLGPNVVGLYHICEAAAEFKVQRLILASTVQVITRISHTGSAS